MALPWYAARRYAISLGQYDRPWCVQRDQPHYPWPVYHQDASGRVVRYASEEAATKAADKLNEESPA